MFIAFVLLQSPEKEPAAVGLFTFFGRYGSVVYFFGRYGSVVYARLAAYSNLYSVPAVLLYVLVSRKLGNGFGLGGGLEG
ncbi:hypothetical protein ACIBCU_29005 [Streptomyces sp. NPDC051064]|uniref:hypothetical protein n=1 Tax=Streptomyces sp. NPDC051064 TaxID=3365641 RepID=UPI003797ADD5